MAISGGQFIEYLKGRDNAGLTNIFEVDFAYETASGPALGTVRFSDKPYDRDPAHRYHDRISKVPEFSRGIDLKRLGGRGTMSKGPLVLGNADGGVDFMLDAIVDAREARHYVGDCEWGREDFRLVNVAVVVSTKGTDLDLTLNLREKNYLLDAALIGDPILSGPNAGKPKPLLFGNVNNFDVTPYLLDSTALTYYINGVPLSSDPTYISTHCSDVRDAGVTLLTGTLFSFTSATMTANTATETLTYTSPHNLAVNDVVIFIGSGTHFAGLSKNVQYWVLASGLTANDFKLSLTRGGTAVDITGAVMSGTLVTQRQRYYVDPATATIQLSSSPVGRVTADVNVNIAGVTVGNYAPHDVFKYLLLTYSQLAASEYDSTAIDALALDEHTAGSVIILLSRAVLDRENLLDFLDEIAQWSFSWYAWNAAGVLTVGRLDLANLDSVTPIAFIDEDDIYGDLVAENQPLPWGKLTLDCSPNSAVQTDGLASSVSAADRSKWGQKFQGRVSTFDPGGTDYLGNWWDYHKSATDSAPLPTSILTNQDVCDVLTDLFKPWTRSFICSVGIEFYWLNPGDCISLSYPRYGLDGGKNARVISVKPRFGDGVCELVLVRQVTPDYRMTDYV